MAKQKTASSDDKQTTEKKPKKTSAKKKSDSSKKPKQKKTTAQPTIQEKPTRKEWKDLHKPFSTSPLLITEEDEIELLKFLAELSETEDEECDFYLDNESFDNDSDNDEFEDVDKIESEFNSFINPILERYGESSEFV